MLRMEARFDEYAYRIAKDNLSNTVTTLEEGQWVTYDANGELVVAGAASVMAWISIGSKRTGRDQVAGKAIHKISYLLGTFMLETSKYDANGTYSAPVTALKLATGGILTPVTGTKTAVKAGVTGTVSGVSGATGACSTDLPALDVTLERVVAYAIGSPSADGYLKIVSA